MKPVTVDMLRAHLLVASLTAAAAEMFVFIAVLVLPVSPQFFGGAPFRLFALAVIVGGVIVTREFAGAAFESAIASHRMTLAGRCARPIEVTQDCPRRWLVVLHLRLTGQPFVLAGH
jgi:hypothetical protein